MAWLGHSDELMLNERILSILFYMRKSVSMCFFTMILIFDYLHFKENLTSSMYDPQHMNALGVNVPTFMGQW